MDPNANIAEQLDLAAEILADIDRADPEEDIDALDAVLANAEKLAQLVLALNQWIATGGFLPERWARK